MKYRKQNGKNTLKKRKVMLLFVTLFEIIPQDDKRVTHDRYGNALKRWFLQMELAKWCTTTKKNKYFLTISELTI